MNYILEDGVPKAEPDLMKWACWFESGDRRVAFDKIGNVEISTVFLGVDHNWSGGRPILYETMVFGGTFDLEQKRYATVEDAREGHRQMVRMVRTAQE